MLESLDSYESNSLSQGRPQLDYIILIEYPGATAATTIPKEQFDKPDYYWRHRYSNALHAYKIWGRSPERYVTKEKLF